MEQFIDVEEARAAILDSVTPLGSERVFAGAAVGRRLRENILAPFDAPAFDNSAMDGFAVRSEDDGQTLEVIGESAAGSPFSGTVGSGQAIRIMTGAAVPDGADCVVPRENAHLDDTALTISGPLRRGAHIRRQGEYLTRGSAALREGDVLTAADIGLLASFGRTIVYVSRAPRITIVTTGTELVEPDRERGSGQIVNSNAYMLEALAQSYGATVSVAPIVPDDLAATRRALKDAARASDMLVTVGGVSVGDYDFVRDVLDELSGGMQFWKVRMKPGKPLAFGVLDERVPVIGLPGNPVSSFVGFHQFVRPALARQQGAEREDANPLRVPMKSAADIRSTPKRLQFVLGTVRGQRFVPNPDQSSGNPLAMCGCTAFGIVDEGVTQIDAGTDILVELL